MNMITTVMMIKNHTHRLNKVGTDNITNNYIYLIN